MCLDVSTKTLAHLAARLETSMYPRLDALAKQVRLAVGLREEGPGPAEDD